MSEINRLLINSIQEIKNQIKLLKIQIIQLERTASQKTDSFDKISHEVENLENAERLIGQVEGLEESIRILKQNFSIGLELQ